MNDTTIIPRWCDIQELMKLVGRPRLPPRCELKARKLPWIRIVRERTTEYQVRPRCQTPYGIALAVLKYAGDSITESMYVVCLDGGNRPIAICEVAKGGIGSIAVVVADIYRPAIAVGASGIVLAHNHPSGNPKPSKQDDVMTRKVKEAGELLGLPLLDHVIIVSAIEHYSYYEQGRL